MAYEIRITGTAQQSTSWMKFLQQQLDYGSGMQRDTINTILQRSGARTVGRFYSKIEFENEEDALFFKLKWGF